MRGASSVLFALAVIFLAVPAPSQAQLVSTGLPCTYLVGTTPVLELFDPDAVACLGAFAGNNEQQEADVIAAIAAAGWGTATDLGTTQAQGDNNEGSLSFAPALNGDYVLALKSSDSFSLYRFVGLVNETEIFYTTLGVSLNDQDKPQGLSHSTLYSTRVSVPEPESAALLLTGLLGLGFVGVRRRRDQVA